MAENEWSEDLKAEIVEAYLEQDPTPDTTMDIVKELATNFDKTPNGVRMVLSRAGVYVKKTAAAAASSSTSGGSKRINKAEAIDALKLVIKNTGSDVDEDICDRLTGKAAVYFTELLK